MYNKLRLFQLKNTNFETKTSFFFIKLTNALEVANFRFMANFRFLTLHFLDI